MQMRAFIAGLPLSVPGALDVAANGRRTAWYFGCGPERHASPALRDGAAGTVDRLADFDEPCTAAAAASANERA